MKATVLRRIFKTLMWLFLVPLATFVLLMVLLYVPPIQHILSQRAAAVASANMGVDISLRRLDLRFPLNLLVSDVLVTQPSELTGAPPDTLLDLGSANLRLSVLPLLKGQFDVQGVQLSGARLNSLQLIDGLSVRGRFDEFALVSRTIDLVNRHGMLNEASLSGASLYISSTPTPDDGEASTPLDWVFEARELSLNQVSVNVELPADTLSLDVRIGSAGLSGAVVDLGTPSYSWQTFSLSDGRFSYHSGNAEASPGFDPNYVALRDVNLSLDSVLYAHRNLNAVLRDASFYDRSGITVQSLNGALHADEHTINLDNVGLHTPHSELLLSGSLPWAAIDLAPNAAAPDAALHLLLNSHIGREDVMLFLGDSIARTMADSYPMRPLVLGARVGGHLNQIQVSQLSAHLPGSFGVEASGWLHQLTDSVNRRGYIDLDAHTRNLNYLLGLAHLNPAGGDVALPDSMEINGHLRFDGPQVSTQMALNELEGSVRLEGMYRADNEQYSASLLVDSLNLNHFLPRDSIFNFQGQVQASGRGLDFASRQSEAEFKIQVDQLLYKNTDLRRVALEGSLRKSLLQASFSSDNALARLEGEASMRMDTRYTDAQVNARVGNVNLHLLGLTPVPMHRALAFDVHGTALRDSARLDINGGDLTLRFKALSSLDKLMADATHFGEVLSKQLQTRILNHADLRTALPSAGVLLRAGSENPVNDYLRTQGVAFDGMMLNYGFTPQMGINGRASVYGLRVDSLLFDTLHVNMQQDTTHLAMQSSVINGPRHPRQTFKATLNGNIRNEDAQFDLLFTDAQGKTGIDLGVNASPVFNGGARGRANGLLLRLVPENPIVAYHNFSFKDKRNWLYWHQDHRVYAGVDMLSDDGLGFHVNSDMQDTLSLQNLNIELTRLELSELMSVMPFMPRLGGLLSVDANFIQTATTMQLSTEADVAGLQYEKRPVGDMGAGFTWLPDGPSLHYIDSYLTLDGEQVAMANGRLRNDTLDLDAEIEHFPLKTADVFMPEKLVNFLGDIDGNIHISGTTANPLLNGSLMMDEVCVVSGKAGVNYRLDNRPVSIVNNRMRFNKFAIYTTSTNPFVIDGQIDFRQLDNPQANLTLKADRYTLLDAPRTRESLLFGKILVDMNALVRGPLSGLVMRGQMNVLGDTNATYVMANSPLVVEDRLEGLVSFVSFSDTLRRSQDDVALTMGGLDMLMTVHIDDAVRLRANLTNDGSKFVELQGGGDLSMQYSPQGDLTLNGRYTLSGGTMKYSLPVIPLKEFNFIQGSYVDWNGDIMSPRLSLTAAERVRANVSDGDGGGSRRADFDVSISIRNSLEAPDLSFDLSAPTDGNLQNELQGMTTEERGKAAITMLATGIYMGRSGSTDGNLSMGSALNSVLQSQINSLAGSATNASFSMGIENRNTAAGNTQTDYTFRYSQRFFNDRVQINIGGKVSTGANAVNNAGSFIDNVSLEYRIDGAGTRYVRAFHNKNYENVLEGEITETGVGIVYRKKMDRLSELLLFRKRPDKLSENDDLIAEPENQAEDED